MPNKRRYTTEQIIRKLRKADILLSQGKSAEEVAKTLEISRQTYYRWRKEYGGLDMTQAKSLHKESSLCVRKPLNRYNHSVNLPSLLSNQRQDMLLAID